MRFAAHKLYQEVDCYNDGHVLWSDFIEFMICKSNAQSRDNEAKSSPGDAEGVKKVILTDFAPSKKVVCHVKPESVEGTFNKSTLISNEHQLRENPKAEGPFLTLIECGDAASIFGSDQVRVIDPQTGRVTHKLAADASLSREVLHLEHLNFIPSSSSSSTSRTGSKPSNGNASKNTSSSDLGISEEAAETIASLKASMKELTMRNPDEGSIKIEKSSRGN